MLFPKFIVYDNQILLDKVRYHKNLLPKDFSYKLIGGGGLFRINLDKKTITFYDESMDFGKFCDNIKECKLPPELDGFEIIVSDEVDSSFSW